MLSALVVAFVAAAVADIGAASGPYRATVNRGFAALASSVGAQSAATGASLRSLLAGAPGMERPAFFTQLDRLAADSAKESDTLAAAVPPAPSGASGAPCLAALADRAAAAARVRLLLEGLLGGRSGTSALASSSVLSDLESAGATVVAGDGAWSSCGRALHAQPGHPRLGPSRWVSGTSPWSPGPLAALVSAVSSSPTLAARPALAITTLVTSPSFLVGAQSAVLPAVERLGVHVVVTNTGNVDDPKVVVTASLGGVPGKGGTGVSSSATVSIVAGASTSVVLASLPVSPGDSYTLVITAAPPSGAGATSTSTALQVAALPPTPTTTTTTTTTTTPRTKSRSALGVRGAAERQSGRPAP